MRRICIISPAKDGHSETFIRSHAKLLPAQVRWLYGGHLPKWVDDGEPLLSASPPKRVARAVLRGLLGREPKLFGLRGALKRFLRREGIEAVVAEYGVTGAEVMDVCEAVGVPLIVHFRGYDAYTYDSPRLKKHDLARRYPILFRKAAAIVAVSHDIERVLLELGASAEKVHYNPSGADVELFDGADPVAASPLFVAVGRFVDKKAPHLTLLAFSEIADAVPDARLVTVGDGPLWEACKQMAQALGIADRVEFRSWMPHEEVAELMRGARAFVQHSVRTASGDSEGTPVAVCEAQAAGLPVVATRHAGIRDVVVEDETGLLVDERDVRGMAEHMLTLARDPELAARLGRAGRERVRERFSMQQSIANLWRVIEQAIEGRAQRRAD